MPNVSRISVIEVKDKSFEEVKAFISGLAHPATGYSPGLETRAQDIDGLFLIHSHRGEITDSVELLRVVGSQIWTKGYADMIERQLRERRMPYRRAEVEVEKGSSRKEHLAPVSLEGIAGGVVYTP